MLLKHLLMGIKYKLSGNINVDVKGISSDSRYVKNEFLFIALKGENQDGHDFIKDAIKNGATVLLLERYLPFLQKLHGEITIVKVDDTKKALPLLAQNFYKNPSAQLDLIAITGTNGKTTISYLLDSIFKQANYRSGIVGTINYRIANMQFLAEQTTPDIITLNKLMRQHLDCGYDILILEASSHGLAQGRLKGIKFRAAVFTNLGKEHLDYHLNQENYYRAKKSLFEQISADGFAIINIDDTFGERLWHEIDSRKISYAVKNKRADLKASIEYSDLSSLRVKIEGLGRKLEIYSSLIGYHNVYNLLAAVGVAIVYGVDDISIKRGIALLSSVPGRMERVKGSTKLYLFVDYAHTPEALQSVLSFLAQHKKNKVWVVFGCGGDRYQEKRRLMGEIAARYADHIIITSDNPRSEDPETIISEIAKGLVNFKGSYHCILERREAIYQAIKEAEPGDIILIAGKGHERYQIYRHALFPFDDSEIAMKLLIRKTNGLI